jgi:glycosyltransferase involved in cell wall biosynthesis
VRILHLSTYELSGGSAKSASRIHNTLLQSGFNSKMIVGLRESTSPHVNQLHASWFEKRIQSISSTISSLTGYQYLFIPYSSRIISHPWVAKADVVVIYNAHGGFIDFTSLAKLFSIKPIVWRLSDLWPLTGHCAYPGNCERWLSGCGQCPDLKSYPGVGFDKTRYLWQKKYNLYQIRHPSIIAPSRWMYNNARRSPLLVNSNISYIPNGIDIDIFSPNDQISSRRILGIKDDNSVSILFIAEKSYPNIRKGTDLLEKALELLSDCNISLIAVGHHSERWTYAVPIKVYSLGSLSQPELLKHAYCASDIVCIPSTHENLPNTVIESLACARPVVAFDSGGIRDAVHHMRSGLLCFEQTPQALADSLRMLIFSNSLRMSLGKRARSLSVESFSSVTEASRVVDVCAEAIKQQS